MVDIFKLVPSYVKEHDQRPWSPTKFKDSYT